MKYCQKCGARLRDKATQCCRCGCPAPLVDNHQDDEKIRKEIKEFLLVILIALLIFSLGVLVPFVIANK